MQGTNVGPVQQCNEHARHGTCTARLGWPAGGAQPRGRTSARRSRRAAPVAAPPPAAAPAAAGRRLPGSRSRGLRQQGRSLRPVAVREARQQRRVARPARLALGALSRERHQGTGLAWPAALLPCWLLLLLCSSIAVCGAVIHRCIAACLIIIVCRAGRRTIVLCMLRIRCGAVCWCCFLADITTGIFLTGWRHVQDCSWRVSWGLQAAHDSELHYQGGKCPSPRVAFKYCTPLAMHRGLLRCCKANVFKMGASGSHPTGASQEGQSNPQARTLSLRTSART